MSNEKYKRQANKREPFEYRYNIASEAKSKTKHFTKTDSKQEQLFLSCYCSDHDLCYTIDSLNRLFKSWFSSGLVQTGEYPWVSWSAGLEAVLVRSMDRAVHLALCYHCLFIDDQWLLFEHCAQFLMCVEISRTIPIYIFDICLFSIQTYRLDLESLCCFQCEKWLKSSRNWKIL